MATFTGRCAVRAKSVYSVENTLQHDVACRSTIGAYMWAVALDVQGVKNVSGIRPHIGTYCRGV